MLPRLNNLLIDNGISFIVSYNIHTLVMYACYLIKVNLFLINAKNNYPRWNPSEAAMFTRHNMTHSAICSINLN